MRAQVAANVDFRMLYFRPTHRLDVQRAYEPSDVIWRNLKHSRAAQASVNVRTTLLVFLVSCVSTAAITMATFAGTIHPSGLLTSVCVSPVVILANVVIFILVPQVCAGSGAMSAADGAPLADPHPSLGQRGGKDPTQPAQP